VAKFERDALLHSLQQCLAAPPATRDMQPPLLHTA
jgi:hypothetical protein